MPKQEIDFTYETGIDEPIHPDFMVASRFIEVGLGNMCDYGCKIYADPRSNVRVLAHYSIYGCNITAGFLRTEAALNAHVNDDFIEKMVAETLGKLADKLKA
jgi:hypothetical protein